MLRDENSFEYMGSNLGFRVEVRIHPPDDERLANGLHFLDMEQILPFPSFLEQAANKFAKGDPDKAEKLKSSALAWDSGQSQSREEKDDGMMVLNAAYELRMKAFNTWQRKNLIPLVNKAELANGIKSAVGTALANFERLQCEEIAEKVGYKLNTTLNSPEGKYKTKKVRGRRISILKAPLGRTKGSKNKKPNITYEKIVKAIRRFKDNEYGIIPRRKEIARSLRCDETTIKNCLIKNGELRRFPEFARALLEET